jgi:hypothetical protein
MIGMPVLPLLLMIVACRLSSRPGVPLSWPSAAASAVEPPFCEARINSFNAT